MVDNAAAAPAEVKTEVVPGTETSPVVGPNKAAGGDGGGGGDNPDVAALAAAAAAKANENQDDDLPVDRLLKELEKKGIKTESLEKLKEKADYIAPAPPLTDEEKQKAQIEKDKAVAKLYIDTKGTPEEFAALKSKATGNPVELGYLSMVETLVESGFDRKKAQERVISQFAILSDEEIANLPEEDIEQAKKDREAGRKALELEGQKVQKSAQREINEVQQQLEQSESYSKLKSGYSASLVDKAGKIERKISVQVGKLQPDKEDSPDLGTLDLNISDSAIEKAKKLLGDADEANNFLITDDGLPNLGNLLPYIAKAFALDEFVADAAKKSYQRGSTEQVEIFEKTYGKVNPGVGGQVKKPDDKPVTWTLGKAIPIGE